MPTTPERAEKLRTGLILALFLGILYVVLTTDEIFYRIQVVLALLLMVL